MSSNYSIKKTISFIKSELKNYYPISEIDSFIFLIFENLSNISRVQIHINPELEIPIDIYNKILQIVNELKDNKPIQYILGKTEFYDLSFKVNSNVLIPRPETEELVDWIIKENPESNLNVLDIGTGSGCIAITLAKNLLNSDVTANDISEKALEITFENSITNNVKIEILHKNILDAKINLNKKYDIIVSNPPYVTESEKNLMHKNVLNFEPHLALFVSDSNPLQFYKAVIQFALHHLNKNGKVYFEINEAFGEEMVSLLQENKFKEISLKKDINDKFRMIRGILK